MKTGYKHEAKNKDGQTAVHIASMQGKDDILRKLIEYSANVNSRDSAGYTPLHVSRVAFIIHLYKIKCFLVCMSKQFSKYCQITSAIGWSKYPST